MAKLSPGHPREFLPLVKRKPVAPGMIPSLDKIAAQAILDVITKEAGATSAGISLKNTALREAARMGVSDATKEDLGTSGPVSIRGLLKRMED